MLFVLLEHPFQFYPSLGFSGTPYGSTAAGPVSVEDMTRACATLTLFLGLPRGAMSFVSSFSSCRPRTAPPRMLLGVWERGSSSQPLRHLRRRRSECLVASVSTSGDTDTRPSTGGAMIFVGYRKVLSTVDLAQECMEDASNHSAPARTSTNRTYTREYTRVLNCIHHMVVSRTDEPTIITSAMYQNCRGRLGWCAPLHRSQTVHHKGSWCYSTGSCAL